MAELIVTGGSVMFEDAIKKAVPDTDPQFYPTKRARAEITFTVNDGDSDVDEAINEAVNYATRKVAEMLGDAHRSPSTTTAAGPGVTEPAKRTRRTKAQIEADEKAADPFDGERPPASQSGGDATLADPFEPAGVQSGSGGASSDGGDDWGAETPANDPEVTDVDLTSAVTKKNAEIKDAQAIRVLIGKFVDAPKGLKDIPQDKRSTFLADLANLTKG